MRTPRHGVGVAAVNGDLVVAAGGSRPGLAPTAVTGVLVTG